MSIVSRLRYWLQVIFGVPYRVRARGSNCGDKLNRIANDMPHNTQHDLIACSEIHSAHFRDACFKCRLLAHIESLETAAKPSETEEIVKERDFLLKRLATAETKEILQLIDERDAAQEAISHAYFLIKGASPEWSNKFGHKEALEEIDDAQKCLRGEIAALEARCEMANKYAALQERERDEARAAKPKAPVEMWEGATEYDRLKAQKDAILDRHVTLACSEREFEVIADLSRRMELSKEAILRQGLRLYQLQVEGIPDLGPKAPPDHPGVRVEQDPTDVLRLVRWKFERLRDWNVALFDGDSDSAAGIGMNADEALDSALYNYAVQRESNLNTNLEARDDKIADYQAQVNSLQEALNSRVARLCNLKTGLAELVREMIDSCTQNGVERPISKFWAARIEKLMAGGER